jgi:hypothetical protein
MLLLAVPAIAQTVTIDGSVASFNPPPIERAGRVFVPLRGVFERLGASVVYQAGQINASGNGHDVSLRIGSNQAVVNGQQQTLDVAPFIVGASTYVPLRFVSQSLGASVNYDNGTNTVAINTNGGGQVASNNGNGSRHARLAAGSIITGTLGNDLNTATANVGDQFVVNVTPPYPNDDGTYANAYVRGQVVAVTRAGQGTRPQLGLAFDRIVFADGRSMPVAGHVTSTDEKHASAIPQQAIGALAGMLVGNIIGKVVLHTSVGGIAGAAGGFLYANNLKTNFVVPKSSTVVIQVDQPLRQAGQ